MCNQHHWINKWDTKAFPLSSAIQLAYQNSNSNVSEFRSDSVCAWECWYFDMYTNMLTDTMSSDWTVTTVADNAQYGPGISVENVWMKDPAGNFGKWKELACN